jgi:hypothetical protein
MEEHSLPPVPGAAAGGRACDQQLDRTWPALPWREHAACARVQVRQPEADLAADGSALIDTIVKLLRDEETAHAMR